MVKIVPTLQFHKKVKATRGLAPTSQLPWWCYIENERTSWERNGLIERPTVRGIFTNWLREKVWNSSQLSNWKTPKDLCDSHMIGVWFSLAEQILPRIPINIQEYVIPDSLTTRKAVRFLRLWFWYQEGKKVNFLFKYLSGIGGEWDLLHGMSSNYPQIAGKRMLFMQNCGGESAAEFLLAPEDMMGEVSPGAVFSVNHT